jgi:hypothetical protein
MKYDGYQNGKAVEILNMYKILEIIHTIFTLTG